MDAGHGAAFERRNAQRLFSLHVSRLGHQFYRPVPQRRDRRLHDADQYARRQRQRPLHRPSATRRHVPTPGQIRARARRFHYVDPLRSKFGLCLYWPRQRASRAAPDRRGHRHTKAIELKPDYAEAYNNRGNAWDDKKHYKRAIVDFDAAIKLNPRHAAAFNNRAISKSNLGDTDGAIADYDAAIKLNPRYTAAFYNRANAKLDHGDKKGAIADYREALKINPDHKQAADMLKELKAK